MKKLVLDIPDTVELDGQRFSPEDLKKFYDRRAEYLDGKTETYTVEEAHNIIRQSRKNNEV